MPRSPKWKEDRCAGCGKHLMPKVGLPEDDRVVKIEKGTMTKRGYKEESVWGWMHWECFRRSMDSPELVMEELGELTRKVDER